MTPPLSSPSCLILLQLCSFLNYTFRGWAILPAGSLVPALTTLSPCYCWDTSFHSAFRIFLPSSPLPTGSCHTGWHRALHIVQPPAPSTGGAGPAPPLGVFPVSVFSSSASHPHLQNEGHAPCPGQRLALPGAFRTLQGDSELELLAALP